MDEIGQRDILVNIARLFEKHKIPYLLTGSLAVSFYGYPRATHDIDFVIEIPERNIDSLIQSFGNLDKTYLIDEKQIKTAVREKSQFDIFHLTSGIKIDFWLLKDEEFDRNKFQRRGEIVVNKQKIPIVSAEDLILTKLLWCKKIKSERHLRDCAGIVKVQNEKLDMEYLAKWADKLKVKSLFQEILTMEY